MRQRQTLAVGDPGAPDRLGGSAWKELLLPQLLAEAWGPRPDGPWWPFHCLTLFAALDYLDRTKVGPLKEDPFPLDGLRPPSWLDATTLLVVDLPGPQSVALGAALAVQGTDLVCTFNNWPHGSSLVRGELTLAALVRYGSWLKAERRRPERPAPVAWLCDSERLGTRKGVPGEFDNRYYIEEAHLPGRTYLSERGVTRIVYLAPAGRAVLADLAAHLLEYRKAGLTVLGAPFAPASGLGACTELALDGKPFERSGFLMASGGGFGATVPHPSSGG